MTHTQERSWKELDECFLTFHGLITLELVARLNSRTRAAEHLNISVTAVNSRLKTMESRIKGAIIDNPRSSVLTPLGNSFRKFWEDSRPTVANLLAEIDQLKNQSDLRLAIVKSAWDAEREWLEAGYLKRLPDGRIHPHIEDGFEAIVHDVRNGVVDIGVASFLKKEEKLPPPVIRSPWRSEHMVLVVDRGRAEYLTNAVVRPEEFKGLHKTFLTMRENTRMYGAVNGFLRRQRIHKYFRYKVPMDDVSTALHEIERGKGVSILPAPAVRQAVNEGKVEMFLLTPSFMRPLDVLRRGSIPHKKSVKVFLECIEESRKSPRRLLGE